MTASIDVLVVGGGIAGLVAANRAAQLGLGVTVVEQGTDDRYLCNTRYTGGTFHIAYNDVAKPADELRAAIDAATAGFARAGVAGAVATDGIRLVRWLRDEGVKFLNLGKYHTFVLAPPSRTGPGLDWEGRGGDVMLRTLEANLRKRGGSLLRGTRALSLDVERSPVIGVVCETAAGRSRFDATAVVIADGGFQADIDLVRTNITPFADKLQQRNARTGRGDGLRMACGIGAAAIGMNAFYGHLLSRDAMTNDRLWPRPYVDALAVAGLVIGADGKRFADEGEGGVYLANAVAQLTDPLSATLVFDQAIWDGPGSSPLIPANPHLPKAGGTLHIARSIADLASMIGVPREPLERTIAQYNDALQNGTPASLAPPRRVDKHAAWPIATPPYYAVPLCAGITNTMGGIAVDEDAAVLDAAGRRIPGIFAAGATTGGLEGGPEFGYVGGLIKAVLGLRAAERIATDAAASGNTAANAVTANERS
jgi:fumarate reductase flavoprotein subunit